MTNSEASALLVELISEFRASGRAADKYSEAVALACAALKINEANRISSYPDYDGMHWLRYVEE